MPPSGSARPAAGGTPPAGGGFPGDPRGGNNQFQKGGGDRGRRDDRRGGKGGRGGMSLGEVKPLVSSENRYVIAAKTDNQLEATAKLKRTTKSLLNKFTPEKFDKLTEQFLELEINSREDMVDVIDLRPHLRQGAL